MTTNPLPECSKLWREAANKHTALGKLLPFQAQERGGGWHGEGNLLLVEKRLNWFKRKDCRANKAQAIEQQRLEAIQDDVVDAEVRREKAIVAKQQASSSGIGGALMTALGLFSDKDLKKNIKPGGRRTREFLDGLDAKEFEYKNGGGVRLGILAQDVNKSKEGQNMTRKVGDSLAIDIPSTTGPVLASLADLNERLAKLEGGK